MKEGKMIRARQARNMKTVTINSTDPTGAHPGLLSTRSSTHCGVLPEGSTPFLRTLSWGQAQSAMN